MPIIDASTPDHAGTVTLTVQTTLNEVGTVTPATGEIVAELLDAAGQRVRRIRAPLTRLTANQQSGLAGLLTTIRNTINAELAG
jgi:hypothetical protein